MSDERIDALLGLLVINPAGVVCPRCGKGAGLACSVMRRPGNAGGTLYHHHERHALARETARKALQQIARYEP